MAANGTGSLVFIAYVTADRGSEMNSEGYKAILLDHIQPKATKLTGLILNIVLKQLKTF